jgi:hypothetical protein
MSGHVHQVEGQERDALADRRLADKLYDLLVDLDNAAAEHPDRLFSEAIDELCDLVLVAQAYTDLAHSANYGQFLIEWHRYARSRLNDLRNSTCHDEDGGAL